MKADQLKWQMEENDAKLLAQKEAKTIKMREKREKNIAQQAIRKIELEKKTKAEGLVDS